MKSILTIIAIIVSNAALASCPQDCQNMTVYTPDGIYRPARCSQYEFAYAFFDDRGFARAACAVVYTPASYSTAISAPSLGSELPAFVDVSDSQRRYRFDGCSFSSSNHTSDAAFNLVALCDQPPVICQLSQPDCDPVFPAAPVGVRK